MIDNTSVIISIILVVMAVGTSLLANPFFRLRTRREESMADKSVPQDENQTASADNTAHEAFKNGNNMPHDNDDERERSPKVSVVVISNGTAQQMDNHLSAILTQHYTPGFEVIVVSMQRDSETDDVLKRYANTPHLYTTFVPQQSLFMSRGKLAVTIGVKAAHHEWILLTDSRYMPQSDEWIRCMAEGCTEDNRLVLGYTAYAADAHPFYRFERLRETAYALRRAAKGRAVCASGGNIMFRKDVFIDNDGYRGNLQYIQGEYDFIVNKYAEKGNTAVMTRPEVWLQEDAPTTYVWRIEKTGFVNYRSKLRGFASYRLLHMADTFCMYINIAVCIGVGIWSVSQLKWALLGVAAFALILTIALRTLVATRKLRYFDAQLSAWRIIPYELRTFWHNWLFRIRYIFADKNMFTSHKL